MGKKIDGHQAIALVFHLLLLASSAVCGTRPHDFEDWAPLVTNTDSVHISASDTSVLVDGHTSARAFERHMKSLVARISSSGPDASNWPPKMKIYGAGLSTLMPNEEQYYVQFAMRVSDLTAAVFQSFTGRPLLGMIADRAFVAVGSRDWMRLALEFPGTAFVSIRSHASKVSAPLGNRA
jgi:hypothetical protein